MKNTKIAGETDAEYGFLSSRFRLASVTARKYAETTSAPGVGAGYKRGCLAGASNAATSLNGYFMRAGDNIFLTFSESFKRSLETAPERRATPKAERSGAQKNKIWRAVG